MVAARRGRTAMETTVPQHEVTVHWLFIDRLTPDKLDNLASLASLAERVRAYLNSGEGIRRSPPPFRFGETPIVSSTYQSLGTDPLSNSVISGLGV
jgi:hypothetical protein